MTSLFFRPAMTLYPLELLKRIGAPQAIVDRNIIAHRRLHDGTLSFREFLTETNCWDMIRRVDDDKFMHYPEGVTVADVTAHINHLIDLLSRVGNYAIILCDTSLPILSASYDFPHSSPPERFTTLLEKTADRVPNDYACVFLHQTGSFRDASDTFVKWLLSHPSTHRDRDYALKVLVEVRTTLTNEGPLLAESDGSERNSRNLAAGVN
jgi:hypothetical protein